MLSISAHPYCIQGGASSAWIPVLTRCVASDSISFMHEIHKAKLPVAPDKLKIKLKQTWSIPLKCPLASKCGRNLGRKNTVGRIRITLCHEQFLVYPWVLAILKPMSLSYLTVLKRFNWDIAREFLVQWLHTCSDATTVREIRRTWSFITGSIFFC